MAKIIKLPHEADPAILSKIGHFLSGLSNLYPGFNSWFANKVAQSTDSIILIAQDGEHLAGVALGRLGDEPKLRCIRVREDLQGSGLGIKLIDPMLDHLQSDKPHVTVAEEMMHSYSRAFMKRYGFALSDVVKGEYRRNKLEYHWN
jgi:N-acetylglutamate synthase-like GNAT family acetyltransferase